MISEHFFAFFILKLKTPKGLGGKLFAGSGNGGGYIVAPLIDIQPPPAVARRSKCPSLRPSMTRAEAATVMSRLLAKGIGPDKGSVDPAPTPSSSPTPATGGEKDADGYTMANGVDSVKPKVGKCGAYKTMGGATYFKNSKSYIQITLMDEDVQFLCASRENFYWIVMFGMWWATNNYVTE